MVALLSRTLLALAIFAAQGAWIPCNAGEAPLEAEETDGENKFEARHQRSDARESLPALHANRRPRAAKILSVAHRELARVRDHRTPHLDLVVQHRRLLI